ncbi:MAG: DUF805 domain-containing protein [Muribaculum sp.]|nr:DUF805 domain-containing protein [Muribaculum sp.]
MATKNQILNNIREYSASEIADAIRGGEISLYELSKSGNLSPLLRKRIEEQLNASTVVDSTITEVASPEEDNSTESHTLPQETAENVMESGIPAIAMGTTEVLTTPNVPLEEVSVNFQEDIIDNSGMFKRPFSFKGRIRRTEYGLSFIIFMIWYAIFSAITEMRDPNPVLALIVLVSIIPTYWFFWAQGAKRCHDRGNSGWYQIIPFYGFVMLFGGSDDGENEYGTNPKE